MRLVLDTNVVLTAFRSRSGASAELLRAVRSGRVRMIASVPLFVEYDEVLMREEHRAATGFSAIEIQQLLDGLAGLVEPVETFYPAFTGWRTDLRRR